jgi:hypothetical protein|tara:strand:- start:560 stop:757 length:198 start_codon:yes stop_codon:yes gene_type:complete
VVTVIRLITRRTINGVLGMVVVFIAPENVVSGHGRDKGIPERLLHRVLVIKFFKHRKRRIKWGIV